MMRSRQHHDLFYADRNQARMKTTLIGLIMSLLVLLCADFASANFDSVSSSTSPYELVVRWEKKIRIDESWLPDGTQILAAHGPYNILIVTDPSKNAETLAFELSQIEGVIRVENGYHDNAGNPVYPTGSIIYEARPGMDNQCREFLTSFQCKYERSMNALGWHAILPPAFLSYEEFISATEESGFFEKIMRDEIITAFENDSNDPLYSSCWYINQFSDKDIDADEAWAMIPSQATNVSVAVIDGHGFDTAHPDLAGNFSDTYNAVDQTTVVTPVSTSEKHGTACAGIPGGIYNNAVGVPGLGYGLVSVQAIKIGYNASVSGSFSTSSVIQADAINRVMTVGNSVCISMSFGSTTYQTTFFNAITSARTQGRGGKGLVVFGSTGNSGASIWTNYPASYNGVIAVGSTTITDNRSSFSNYGSGLTLCAPGSGIYTTDVSGANGYTGTDYTNFSGTSAACPVAASAGAVLILSNATLTEAQVKQILAQTCEKVGGYTYSANATNTLSSWSAELGYGRINMKDALIAGLQNVTITPDISVSSSSVNTFSPVTGQSISITASQFITPAIGATVFPIVEYRWSSDQTWSANDIIIGTDGATLGGGISSENESINFTVPNEIGTRYILIKCDGNNAVVESNENNNIAIISVNVSAAPVVPDLTMTAISVNDNTPNVGQSISINCTQVISNASNTAMPVVMEYRYSTDAVWSAGDILIGTDTSSIGTSQANQSESINFTIPDGIGTRYILFKADSPGSISETNENNNNYSVMLTVAAALPLPDVTINQITATATSVNTGQSVTVLCQQAMTNTSNLPVAIAIEYWWSTDLALSSNDLLMGSGVSNLSNSSNSETEALTFTIPATSGTNYLLIKADAANSIVENNESNLYSIAFTVTNPTGTPDVFVDAFSISGSTVVPGQIVTVNCDQNISLANVNAVNVFLEYRWGTTPNYSTSFPILGIDYSSLGAGDLDDPESLMFTVPAGSGQKYLLIICDSGNGILEANETNNVLAIPVNVVASNIPSAVEASDDEDNKAHIGENDNSSATTTETQDYGIEFAQNDMLEIFPNPSNGLFQLNIGSKLNGENTISIYDSAGLLVYNNKTNGNKPSSNAIDISYLSSGIYFLQVTNKNLMRETRRIVINH